MYSLRQVAAAAVGLLVTTGAFGPAARAQAQDRPSLSSFESEVDLRRFLLQRAGEGGMRAADEATEPPYMVTGSVIPAPPPPPRPPPHA